MRTPSALTSFSSFPPEIQNMIWQTAVDSVLPRIVEVTERIAPKSNSSMNEYGIENEYVSKCPIPGVLHACRASRSIALTRWRLSFAARYQGPKIFFDFEEDVLYFGEHSSGVATLDENLTFTTYLSCMGEFADAVDFGDRQITQRLAFHLDGEWTSGYFADGEDLSQILCEDFPNISKVLLVESDLDNMAMEGSKQLRRSSRLAKLQPPMPKRDHKNPIIRFVKPNPPTEVDDINSEIICDFRQAYEDTGLIAPGLIHVNYYTGDLSEYEYNEDQRRLENTLFTRYCAEMRKKRSAKSKSHSTPKISGAEIRNDSVVEDAAQILNDPSCS